MLVIRHPELDSGSQVKCTNNDGMLNQVQHDGYK